MIRVHRLALFIGVLGFFLKSLAQLKARVPSVPLKFHSLLTKRIAFC